MMHWGFNPVFGGGGWLLMGVGMILQLLFWVVVVYIGVKLLSGAKIGWSGSKPDAPGSGRQTAEEIVKQRYARGEITKEQLKEMINDLRQ